uniref:Uncharacterized protein n=1 Tax=Sinocyclocheilus anshuiensis TaxID=1608454 RepID=A0A671QDY8_9TELE
MTSRCSIRSQGTNTWKGTPLVNLNSAPNALDALSLASWKSSLSERLTHLISSEAVLPASRKSPVDFSSMPAISLEKTNQ